MLSKNNYKLQARKLESKRQHFTIKKFTVGVASILVGSTFAIGVSNDQVFADDTNASVVENVDETQENPPDSVTLSSTAPESTADASTDVSSNTSADQAVDANATESVADQAVDTDATGSVADQAVDTNATGSVADQTTPESSNAQASAATPQSSAATSDAQSEANTATTPVVSEENSTASAPNTASDAQSLAGSDVANNENTTQNDTQAAPLTTSSTVNAPVTRAAVAAADDTTSTTVNSWNGLISALNNSQYQTINVSGVLTAAGTTQIFGNNRTVVIKGSDQKAGINFRDTPLKANGSWNITFDNLNLSTSSANGVVTFSDTTRQNSVTFKDVRHVGSSLYGGSGNVEVVIDGNTTSTVSNASTPTVNTYKTNGNDANIWGANSVTVANGATFTLNRSAIGDGINLPDGSTVRVGDNATMTINMNTNNATDSARYHDAGIFMLNGGNFLTGKNSTVNMNTSLGQAVSIGANRPGIGITDTNRFGGYTANQSRNDGPTTVTFGDHSTFNFTGRDGFILGNNANFTSGEYSNVHFQNKGNGVALDLANNSNIVISKHSNTLFESDGKGNKSGSEGSDSISGSYNAYNYIGVNEGGNITIDEYATFRVILTNRGSNPWDDVISLDSRNANTTAAFTSKKGAIVDIRDDNTNFYAELISFPLGAANSLIDIQDPLYLNLQRYTAGGKIDGWMPVGGTEILQTDNKHYGNLIYMGGTKGVLKIGGTDYVVYQQIKSDNAQQIWLNVNSMTSPKHGFNAAETFNNNANPDMSISGVDLTANVAANNVKDNNTSPTVKGAQGTPPYYGISSQRASHQIWFPHDTVAELIGSHQNVIRYVYEDGTPVLGSDGQPLVVTQDVDLARQFELSITPEKIQDIQNYASTHTADETLQYIRGTYVISKDSGWKVTDSTNTKTSYDAVTSPVLDGYKATIQTTNANGVTVGANADTVQATLALDPNAAITDDAFKQAYTSNVNGSLGIPTNYETVVVYKKDVQSQKVTIIYQDKSDNNKELAKDEIEGKAGDALGYSTADKIQNYLNKGYKLVSDGVPPTGTFGDAPETYYVILEHDTAPVGPTDPHDPGTPINPDDPDGPKWPTKDNYEKEYTSTVEFVDEQGNKMPNIPDDKQTSTWTRTLNVDKVTGEILNPDEAWTPDKPNYSKVNVPVVPGYYADKPVVPEKPTEQTDLIEKVVYKPMGKVTPVDPDGNPIPGGETPQYPNDPNDPTKAGTTPFPEIPGYHLQDPDKTSVTPTEPGKDTPVVYVKDEADKYNLVEKFVDENGKELAPTVTKGTNYTEGATYDVTGDKKVIDGYYLKEVPANATGTFGKADVTVTFVYAPLGKVTPVDPDGNPIPGGETPQYPNDPNDPTKAGTTPFLEIPGYHLEDPDKTSVTPTEPGKDTPVVYVKDEADKYNLVEKFVDENGKELAPTVTKGTDYTEGATYDVTGDKKVIDGYYLKEVPTNATGTFGKADVTVTFVYAPLGKVTPVDPDGNPIPGGETPQYPNDPNDPTKAGTTPFPEIPGYHLEDPDKTSVTPTEPGKDTPVVYVKDEADKYNLVEKFVDENGKELAPTVTKGTDYTEGATYDVTGDKKVIDGYYLKEVPTNATGTFGKADVTVTFVYAPLGKVIPVDPDGNPIPDVPNPQYPNDPNDPTKGTTTPVPEIPGYRPEVPSVTPDKPGENTPVVYVPITEGKYTLTEKFVDESGKELAPTVTKGTDYTEGATYDVTGDKKVIDGYYLKEVPTNATGTFGKADVTVTFVYAPLGKVIPVDPDGNPIPDVPNPQYPNDPNDPTKGTTTPVPEIPGYRPEVPSVTPDKPGENTPVVYVPITEGKYTLTEKFVDENGKELAPTVTKGTEYAEGTTYDVTGDKKVIDGYYLKEVPTNATGTFGKADVTVTFVYAPLGKVIPVDPDGNPIPDVPNPQYPNDPNDPTKGTTTPVPEIPGYRPEVPSVTPDKPGENTPVVYVPITEEKYTLTEKFVDENGKELAPTVTKGTDYAEGTTYDVTGDKKVIDGYYLKEVPTNATGTFGKEHVTVTFVYAPLGKVIPVDPDGNPIPDVPNPQYPNDPNDPTKGTTTPVPEIPGYTPVIPSVTPDKPGEDTKVTYVLDDQKATINYLDETKGQLITSDDVTGKSSAKIDYTTADKIKELVGKGYILVSDGFPTDAMFDNDKNTDQFYTVILKHDTAPVGPTDPHEPGTPINPDDPNGPKWPAKDQYTKEYTSTIEYVDENGNKIAESNVQTSTWTRTLNIDKVTGEVLNPNEAWVTDKKQYNAVTSPLVEGYYADKADVLAKDTVQENIIEKVVYRPLGKVVPVDPDGNPIPNVPNPQYPNDPNDPTKGTTTPVPEIPGYRPEVPSVTPDKPGENTPVVYVPVTDKYSLVEKFVDEDGNELSPTVTKGTDYTEGSTYDVTGDAKVIEGYYLKEMPANTKGTFGKDNVTITFTYVKMGKIIPVDPDGNPIPNVPNPQYPNDPNDPTKGTTTPVPEIPGYRPEVPSVTPDKPGEDTKVVYVPVKDQAAKIIYIDEKTGQTLVTDSTTGKSGTKIDYSPTDRIKSFTDKGYVVIENGFTKDGEPLFDDDDSVEQVYVIKLGHATAPVGPNDPHEPGTLINPNDPNGPKWPAVDEYTKKYTSTVHFVDENGNKLRDDDVQTSTWTRKLIIDKVTGEILNPNENWVADKDSYVEVRVPVINGYYANKALVPGEATKQKDLETTVIYKQIGKVIPVDPSGVPIPNVPTPQYRNDPNDPTKVLITDVPTIAGMTPEVNSVDPSDPGVDTPVVYNVLTRPETPTETTPTETDAMVTPAAPVDKTVTTPVNNVAPTATAKQATLPQTGDEDEHVLAVVGALLIAGMLGLAAETKKKKDDKKI